MLFIDLLDYCRHKFQLLVEEQEFIAEGPENLVQRPEYIVQGPIVQEPEYIYLFRVFLFQR